MPVRNVNKPNVPEAYYHVYARGASKQKIFCDSADYQFFLNLFDRYLSEEQKVDAVGVPYPHLYGTIEVLAFCLMQNHFHLLFYQIDGHAMERLMRSLMTSYSRYFNRKYKRSGPVFETRYKASHIGEYGYLMHISRYIHLNPSRWRGYRNSSLSAYLGKHTQLEWLQPQRITQLFENDSGRYLTFLEDYEETQRMRDELKHLLADS